jgi:hypothetical protein
MLAPGPRELALGEAELHARLQRADAISAALARLQNRIGEAYASGQAFRPCTVPGDASLVARTRVFGAAARDAVQSARAELDRMDVVWDAPTVVPLLDDADLSRASADRAHVVRLERAYLEAAAWQEQHVERRVDCHVEVVPVPGLSYDGPVASDDPVLPVPIYAFGGGTVCPVGEPADGRVVLTDGRACIAEVACECSPVRVLPGAVLGQRVAGGPWVPAP